MPPSQSKQEMRLARCLKGPGFRVEASLSPTRVGGLNQEKPLFGFFRRQGGVGWGYGYITPHCCSEGSSRIRHHKENNITVAAHTSGR